MTRISARMSADQKKEIEGRIRNGSEILSSIPAF